MADLTRGHFGYAFDSEDVAAITQGGEDPLIMLKRFRDSFPKINIEGDPLGVIDIKDQGPVGSCVGQSIAQVFSICYWLATGRKEIFSAAAGYYLSQKVDGIRGDSGATISGAMKVATTQGLCLEKDWPYVPRYSPVQPQGISFPYLLKVSKPIKDVDVLWQVNEEGLPVHFGRSWNKFDDAEVVTNWSPLRNSGGHATTLWQRFNQNINDINSWGKRWSTDGQHQYTYNAMKSILADRWTVAVAYAPAGMEYPVPDAIS
jgi:hypothetical protein